MAQQQPTSIPARIVFAALFYYVATLIEPNSDEMAFLQGLLYVIAALNGWKVVRELPNPIYNWFKRRRARQASDRHGTARWADKKEISAGGMHEADGLFLGASAYDGKPIFQHGEGHWMVYAPTRSGKSRNLVMPNILHHRGSMLIADIKGELWDVTAAPCKRIHKNTLIRLDPAGLKNADYGIPARYNPLSRIIEPWLSGMHKDVIVKTRMMVLQILPEPTGASENTFFRNGSRKAMTFAVVYVVIIHEHGATLSKVVALIQDSMAMQEALQIAQCWDVLSGDLARMAKDLLRTLESKDSHHWESFCEGAVQVLDIYSDSGHLAETTSACDFYFRDLKEKDCKIFEIVDPTRMHVFAPWLGLLHWCALDELLSVKSNKDVILMLDEASNFRVSGLVEKLTLLAGYHCRAIVVLQSFSAFEKTYSKQDLEILLDQCECKIWMKVQSYNVASMLSKSLGSATQITEHYHTGHDYRDLVRDNLGEIPRSLMTADEIMRTHYTIIQLRGKYPILAETVGYDAVKPWNKWAKPNTLYGNKPFISKTRIKLDYPSRAWWATCFGLIKRKPIVIWYRRIKQKRDWSILPFALIHTVRALLMIAPILALWWIIESYGNPHVLWEYTYRGTQHSHVKETCTYIGFDSRKTRFGPDCPLIQLFKDDAQ